jgi:hypothetical protein
VSESICRGDEGRPARYLAASTRFNPTIAGSEPVGNGSAFGVSGGSGARGGGRESPFHFTQEAVERIDARRHLSGTEEIL